MRVLHFLPVYVPAWQFGGPILSVSRLCEGLVKEGVDVRVITTNAGLPHFPHDQLAIPQIVNGVQVTYYPDDQEVGVIHSRALVEALPEHMEWADLLHLSSIWQPMGLSVQKAAHAACVPVIQTLRGALGPYSWRRGWWKKIPYFFLNERPLLQRAAALHCTTSQEASEIAWLRLRPPIHLIANPMDLSQLYPNEKLGLQFRHQIGISDTETLFLVVGRLHHKKGLDFLPNVLERIAHRRWQILFVGKDEDGTGSRLKRDLMRIGLSDRCHWLEHLPAEQLAGPYNAADCLLLPSRHENFGNVVVEALACGCAVLVSDHVGVTEAIRACPGVHISPRSSVRWISHLNNILSSTKPCHLSAQWVFNHYSKSLVARQAILTYKRVLKHA